MRITENNGKIKQCNQLYTLTEISTLHAIAATANR